MIDLENDKRYLDLLDTVSSAEIYFFGYIDFDHAKEEALRSKDDAFVNQIKLIAQNLYFEEELKFKNTYCGLLEGLIRGYESEVPELTKTIEVLKYQKDAIGEGAGCMFSKIEELTNEILIKDVELANRKREVGFLNERINNYSKEIDQLKKDVKDAYDTLIQYERNRR